MSNLLIGEKLFSLAHLPWTDILGSLLHYTKSRCTCSVLPRLMDVASWRLRHALKAGCKDMWKGKGKASSDHVTLELNFHRLLVIMRCENCLIEQQFGNQTFDGVRFTNRSALERSIVFDWQNLNVCSIRFDWVRQSNDWCSIGFDYRTVRLDTPGWFT